MAKAKKKTKSIKKPTQVWVVTHRIGEEVCLTLFRKEKDAVEHFDYIITGICGTEVTDDQVADVIKGAHEYDEYWYNNGGSDGYDDGEVTLRSECLH